MEMEIWWAVGCGVQCGSCATCHRVMGADSGMQNCETQENNEVWHIMVGMELLEGNRSHGETGRGMMGDCVGCPGCDRLGRMVVVGVTHGDGFGGGGYGGFDNGMVPAWE